MRRLIPLLVTLALPLAACGDDAGEGNNNNWNQAVCGNGVVDQSEQCDDGEANSDLVPDACRSSCRQAHCGDEVIDTGEFCDGGQIPAVTCQMLGFDGGEVACSATCEADTQACWQCGNGLLEEDNGETCDGSDVGANSCQSVFGLQEGSLACTGECALDGAGCYTCGNGQVEGPEVCDDGTNDASYDGCAPGCLDFGPHCGDSVVQANAGEVCDDGVNDGSYGSCLGDCSGPADRCGDGAVNGPEVCDDGSNDGDYDGCMPGCLTLGPRCGDGQVQANEGEVCDDAVNNGAYSTCMPGCQALAPHCGDSIPMAIYGEVCDDGTNDGSYDGCMAGCQARAAHCGDAAVNGPEECDATDLAGTRCVDLGHTGGLLVCAAGCTFDHDRCFDCGDGVCDFALGETAEACPGDCGWSTLSAGDMTTCAVKRDGTLWCWGNAWGGVAGTTNGYPAQVAGLSGVRDVALGGLHTCAITNDNDLYCWGMNGKGQVGDGTITNRNTPVAIAALADIASKAWLGSEFTCAMDTAYHIWCWGENDYGQLGIGSFGGNHWSPELSQAPMGARDFAAGANHACAYDAWWMSPWWEHETYCWGWNDYGQLGTGNITALASPSGDVLNSGGLVSAGGLFSCGMNEYHNIRCWGANTIGQLGNGTNTASLWPVDVDGEPGDVVQMQSGSVHTCVRTEHGHVWCWGGNQSSQIGDNSTTHRTRPVRIWGANDVATLGVGNMHTCAITFDGRALCWGSGNVGRLGTGSTANALVPTPVVDPYGCESAPDWDGDGVAGCADPCPLDPTDDADGDGICEDVDNCPGLANPGQEDLDGDGVGDQCEVAGCGNGAVEAGEACDDGNPTPGDGCDAACQCEATGTGVGPGCAGVTCQQLLTDGHSTGDGYYWIDPAASGSPYAAWCDMTRDGGGWTLVLTTSDDGQDTWTYNHRTLMTTDTALVGSVSQRHRDYKSAAYHEIDFADLLFVHAPSGVWAAYHGVGNGTNDVGTFQAALPFPNCNLASGHAMSAGTLALTDQMCSTDLYFHPGDEDGGPITATCSTVGGTYWGGAYGPAWDTFNNGGACHFDDPGAAALGPDYGTPDVEQPGRGWGMFTTTNRGRPGQAVNYLQMFVR